jgi:predicted 2-oxoglutarate/Fe(II)-dependent dioxygenase YbiX
MQLIAHSDHVYSIDSFLTVAQCDALITDAESQGFGMAGVRTTAGQKMMPNIRNNERAQYPSEPWVALLWEYLSKVQLPTLDGQAAIGLPKDIRFYKYSEGQRFKMHKDGNWVEGGLTSKLTLLVYLNNDFEGGETDFRDFKISPKKGTAVLFVHDTWHEGARVTHGVKYIARSDVLYG